MAASPRVSLSKDDPTVFVKCLPCSRTGLGTVAGTYFGAAYPVRKAKKKRCPNCGGPLTEIYRVVQREAK